MKRIKKGLLLLIVLISSLILLPIKVNAETFYSENQVIGESHLQFKVGDLKFDNIQLDYDQSINDYKLYGTVTNYTSAPISFDIIVEYYDRDYILVGNATEKVNAEIGANYIILKPTITKMVDTNTNDIKYFKLRVITSDQIKEVIDNVSAGTDYYIKNYDINIKVNENNTYDVTEKITAYFNVPKHGIIRKIPMKNEISRLDGTKSKKRAQVLNVKVDNKYETSVENNYYQIKIGSADTTIKGDQVYTIKYKYNIGKDPLKNKDEFYFDIIGNEWDTSIKRVKFKINMPKEFDSSKLGFSYGPKGSAYTEKIKYSVEGNKIIGSFEEGLKPGEGITVRCELPEEYFVGEKYSINFNIKDYTKIIYSLILLLVSTLIWYKYGKDDTVIETVEFYPPKDYNSLEVSFLYNGRVDEEGVLTLLFELANKGYIKIEAIENKEKDYDDFKITKIKDYDGNNINELRFLEGMFTKKTLEITKGKPKIKVKKYKEVKSEDLEDRFYITIKDIEEDINTGENIESIYKASTIVPKMILIILMLACIPIILPIIIFLLRIPLFIPMIVALLFYSGINNNEMFNYSVIIILELIICIAIAVTIGMIFNGFTVNQVSIPIGFACFCGIIILYELMNNRTQFGNEIYGKLSGLANFIKTTDKEKLEELTLKDAHYFYDILPYAIALGVGTRLIDKFKNIAIKPPKWYVGTDSLDFSSFADALESTIDNISTASSPPVSESSSGDFGGSDGGFSGGGFSGGGSGGGGGSSW